MKNIAVIVDDRGIPDELIDGHMRHLPEWDLDIVDNHSIKNGHDYNALLTMTEFWER